MSTQKEKVPPSAADPKKPADPRAAPAADPKAGAHTADERGAAAGPGSPKNAGSPTAGAKPNAAPGVPAGPKVVYVTIDSYDFRKPQEINSPRSLQAMKFLGVVQTDLKCKTEEDLKPMFNLQDKKEKEAYDRSEERRVGKECRSRW